MQGKKIEVTLGQQSKAYQMLCSGKIVSVKVLRREHDANINKLYVKSVIKKSYGETTRKRVIQFDSGSIPEKSHCECPVGLSGIPCWTELLNWVLLYLGILTFFKNILMTQGKNYFEFTPTEQLQKCYRRIKKSSVPMTRLRNVKIRAARKRTGSKIVPADGDQSKSKHNVKRTINEIKSALEKCDIPFGTYTFNVLQKYDSKCTLQKYDSKCISSLHHFEISLWSESNNSIRKSWLC